jgi:hypothetical protein
MILKQLDGIARSIDENRASPADPRNDDTTEVPIGIRNNFRLGPHLGAATAGYPARYLGNEQEK